MPELNFAMPEFIFDYYTLVLIIIINDSQKQIPIGYEAGLRARDRHTHACAVSRYEHAVKKCHS